MLPHFDPQQRCAIMVLASLWVCAFVFIALGALLPLGLP